MTRVEIEFVYGVLPAIVVLRDRGEWGQAFGPVAIVPSRHRAELLPHELFHVRQWYVTFPPMLALAVIAFLLMPGLAILPPLAWALWWRSPYVRWQRETAAYAEVCRAVSEKPDAVDSLMRAFSNMLTSSPRYSFGPSETETLQRMRARYLDGRLF